MFLMCVWVSLHLVHTILRHTFKYLHTEAKNNCRLSICCDQLYNPALNVCFLSNTDFWVQRINVNSKYVMYHVTKLVTSPADDGTLCVWQEVCQEINQQLSFKYISKQKFRNVLQTTESHGSLWNSHEILSIDLCTGTRILLFFRDANPNFQIHLN